MSNREVYMSDKFLGVSDIVSLIGVSFFLGTGVFLRTIYNELTIDSPNLRTLRDRVKELWLGFLLFRFCVLVSGSTTGAWLAGVAWAMMNIDQGEWLCVGLGGVMGWKLLDAMQQVFISKLADMLTFKKGGL